MNRQMDEKIEKWVDGWMERWIDEWRMDADMGSITMRCNTYIIINIVKNQYITITITITFLYLLSECNILQLLLLLP